VVDNMASSILGSVHGELGDLDQALHHFHHALAVACHAGHRLNEVIALYNLGDTYRKLGQYDTAIDCLRRAHAHGGLDRYVLTSFGDLYRDRNQPTKALEHYREALDLAREDADRGLQAEILVGLGDLAEARGAPDHALTHYQQALSLAREIHYSSVQARAHHGLALTYHGLAQSPQSLHQAKLALRLYTDLNSPKTDQVQTLIDKQWRRPPRSDA
jgi:tetratricopeptide (TPR) repeat protein